MNVLRWLLYDPDSGESGESGESRRASKKKELTYQGSGHQHNNTNNHHQKSELASWDETNSGALALHYAAARGCLDCVKLLVESSPDFRYRY
jgi:hypothetical protein